MGLMGARRAVLLSGSGLPVPALDLNFMTGAMPSGITFTRSSSAWTFDGTTLTAYASNAPRLTASGLLIEESRVNLFLNSAVGVTQSCTVAAAANTLSFYGTGTITLTGVSTAGPLVGTGASDRVSLTFTPTAGSLTLTVSGSATNVQLELGAFATSPIVTVGSTVTRASDAATINPLGSWFNAVEGTLLVEASRYAHRASQQFATFHDGTGNNTIGLVNGTGTPAQQRGDVTVGGVAQAQLIYTGAATVDTVYRQAIAYRANDFAGSMNGGAVLTDGSGTIPTVDRMSLGVSSAGTVWLAGHVRRARYYGSRLSNATLQALTR